MWGCASDKNVWVTRDKATHMVSRVLGKTFRHPQLANAQSHAASTILLCRDTPSSPHFKVSYCSHLYDIHADRIN